MFWLYETFCRTQAMAVGINVHANVCSSNVRGHRLSPELGKQATFFWLSKCINAIQHIQNTKHGSVHFRSAMHSCSTRVHIRLTTLGQQLENYDLLVALDEKCSWDTEWTRVEPGCMKQEEKKWQKRNELLPFTISSAKLETPAPLGDCVTQR